MVKNVLVIGGKPSIDWFQLFQGRRVHGNEEIRVDFARWDEVQAVCYHDSTAIVELSASSNPIKGTNMASSRTFQPHIVLVRSTIRALAGQDWRNALFGLMYSQIPAINTLESLYNCQEKPIIYGKLNEIRKRVGHEKFPLIPQTYYSGWKTMTFHTDLPLVVKVGTCHAGFGKMKIKSEEEFEDFRSIIALSKDYVTAEPFIEWDYDFRIQKIGSHYRAFKRYSSNWKGKGNDQHDEDAEVTPEWRSWIDLAAEALGMDICTLDGLHSKKDDKEWIIELNDSASGFNMRHEQQDLVHVADLVIQRLESTYAPVSVDSSSSSSSSSSSPSLSSTSKKEKKKKEKKEKNSSKKDKRTR